jgi:hypothetical protein
MLRDLERARNDREAKAARLDPVAHKLSKLLDGPERYRYWPAGKDGRGRTVRFCYATVRNVAGYYLTWREVETPVKRKGKPKTGDLVSTTERDQWAARKLRRAACALAEKRAAAFKVRQSARKT